MSLLGHPFHCIVHPSHSTFAGGDGYHLGAADQHPLLDVVHPIFLTHGFNLGLNKPILTHWQGREQMMLNLVVKIHVAQVYPFFARVIVG